jgi:hypothetical protein
MGENLYPEDGPKTRRRGRRAPRPKHLPPYIPSATTASEFDAAARVSIAAAPPPPSFGARGGHPALRFHQAKTSLASASSASSTDHDDDDDNENDDNDDG